MRIPTFNQYQNQVQTIAEEWDKIGKLRQQMESQQKILHSSDDPVLANQIKNVQNFIETLETYSSNTALAKNHGDILGNGVKNAIDVTSEIKQSIVQLQSGTLNDSAKQGVILGLKGYLENLLHVANTQDGNRNYIFSGSQPATAAYALSGGKYVYNGGEATTINVGTNTNVIYNDDGSKIFDNFSSGNGTFTIKASNSNTGGASTDGGSVDAATYVPDNYTITFLTNTAGELAYKVVGANSGQIIPSGSADAPAYVPGSVISFNGVSLTISNTRGLPKVGDSFDVAPSTKDNIFNIVQDLINTLNDPSINTNNALMDQALTQANLSITQAGTHLVSYQTTLGVTSAEIDKQTKRNQDNLLTQKELLSSLSDADLSSVISELMNQSLILQASTESYKKMQDLFTQLITNF